MDRVLVISNMFPDKRYPTYGIFVKRFCDELKKSHINYEKSVLYKENNKLIKIFKYLIFYFRSFIKYFNKNNKTIYIHYASYSSLPIIIGYFFKKKRVIVNVHGSDIVPENKLHEKMNHFTKKILTISSKVVVPSEYFKRYIIKKYNVNERKIFVYPSCGINKSVFYQKTEDEKKESRKKYGIEYNKVVFGYVGRISSGKGWNIFAEAIKKYSHESNSVNVEFVIVGSGPEEKKLLKIINDVNEDICIKRFPLLPQDELCDMYNAFDYFIFPTEREGESLGLVGIESMACGCPVICSDFAAPKYYVNDKNGFKFKKSSPEDLLECIKKAVLLDEKQKKELIKGALQTAQEYETSKIRGILVDIINKD